MPGNVWNAGMQTLRYAALVHAAHPYLRAACAGRLHEVQRAFHAAELADLHGEAAQLGMLEGAVGLFRTGEGLVQAQRRVERTLQGGQAGERVVAMPRCRTLLTSSGSSIHAAPHASKARSSSMSRSPKL